VRTYGGPLFGTDNLPSSTQYTENAAGQYYVSSGSEKRASFADAEARHKMFYSRYHKSKYMCASCHDFSNPVLANIAFNGTPPGDGTTILVTEESSAHSYFHVERTFSEFILSAYGQQGGAAGIGPFAPELFNTVKQRRSTLPSQQGVIKTIEFHPKDSASQKLQKGW